jgi:anti-anti-sigma factor
VERGPDCVFVRLHAPERVAGDGHEMAEVVWNTMQQHLARRVVLEMDELKLLHSRLIGELVLLHKKICSNGGTLRVCGLSEANQEALRATRLDNRVPCYRNRIDAVMGSHPSQAS